MSLTATTSMSPRSSDRRTKVRPMRPKPLIPTRMVITFPSGSAPAAALADALEPASPRPAPGGTGAGHLLEGLWALAARLVRRSLVGEAFETANGAAT